MDGGFSAVPPYLPVWARLAAAEFPTR
jgi:hypothetical protein